MRKGVTLVELMVSMAIASIVVLVAYGLYSIGEGFARTARDSWRCMQSLRAAVLQLDQDLMQCAYLLPQDLKIAVHGGTLFISGLPATAGHTGLRLNQGDPPPYYAVVRAQDGSRIRLDTVDIDGDHDPDFWADLGVITDAGAYVIAHAYVRGTPIIPLEGDPVAAGGARAVPAVHYELRDDGLYRDGQILAEGIDGFTARLEGHDLTVYLRVTSNGTARDIHYRFALG